MIRKVHQKLRPRNYFTLNRYPKTGHRYIFIELSLFFLILLFVCHSNKLLFLPTIYFMEYCSRFKNAYNVVNMLSLIDFLVLVIILLLKI